MTRALRQTVKDKIAEIHPNNYSTLLAATNELNDQALGDFLTLLNELEARTERERRQKYMRY